MALLAALQLPSDAESCRRFCQEALQARHVGPAEQRQLYERLPWLMQRLHGWFALSNPGLEEAVLRTFHAQGPLSPLFAAMETPAFIFPLRKLPPRTLKTVLAASNSNFRFRDYNNRQMEDLNQSLLAVLGMDRLSRTSGTSGELEGLALTAQECVLTTLVYFLVAEVPVIKPSGSSSGATGSSGASTGGTGSTGWGQQQGSGGSGGSGGPGGTTGSRGGRQQGMLSSTFERLLLAHLHAYLPHRQYEVARAQESRASLFLTRLFHEFLIEQRPQSSASLVLQCFSDVRLQPAALHSCRLVLLHIIANPCLRQGCEETAEQLMFAARGRNARITRELSMLGPAVLQMLCELLRKLQSQKEVGLETISSMTRLWLILLQPWKAPRLYQWYLSLRSPEPKLEAPAPATRSAPTRPVDVALLGLEPEMAGEPPVPQVPKDFVEEEALGALSATTRLAAAAGLTAAAVQVAASSAQAAQLVPGDGDAISWRNYVAGFQGAYFLLESILSTPLHAELCLELARSCAGWDRGPGLLANVGLTAASSARSSWGNAPAPTAQQLLRQRNAIQALKVLAQVLLCFSDTQLLQVLHSCPPQDIGIWLLEYGVVLEHPMLPIFEDSLRPQLLMAVSVTWAALLAAAPVVELQPLLAAVSRQLQHSPHWAGHFPALEETSKHKPFAETVLKEIGQARPSEPAASAAAAPAAAFAAAVPQQLEFRGPEWQRPVRGGELEQLLCIAYWLANAIDRMLGRCPVMTPCGPVPQTEWPRVLGNWKFTLFLTIALLLAVLW